MIPLSDYVLYNIFLYTLAILQCKKAAIRQRLADNNDIESSRKVAERKRKRGSGWSRPKKNENLEKCIGRREAQHRRWFRGCVNVSERRSPCQGCLLCPRNVGSGGTPERKKWGLEQVPFFCLCSTALTTSFPSRALFSWELGTTRFRLRPRGLTCMYVFMSMDQCCYFFPIFFLCLLFNVIFVEDQ